MDWRLVGTAFVTVLLAELGDKTQLAALGLSASSSSRLAVFLGASAALVTATAVAVVAGDALGRVVPQVWLQRGAAVLFVAIGVFMLLGSRGG